MASITQVNKTAGSLFDLKGHCRTREAYWRRLLLIVGLFIGVFIVTSIFVSTLQSNFVTMTGGFTIMLAGLAAIAAVVTLVVQRLRTLGAHWAFVFLLVIPPVAAIMIAALGILTPPEESAHSRRPRQTKTQA